MSPSPHQRELADVLRELGWTVHRRTPERAGVGPIPTTELALLKQVIDAPGSTVGELAQALGLRQPNVSAAIRVLADRGYVVKESSPKDRRITLVRPTALGCSEHEAIADSWAAPIRVALEGLSADHRSAIEQAAEALAALHERLRVVEQGEAQGPAQIEASVQPPSRRRRQCFT
ncbi:MarR family winged helix-turn-helix transcriptional regulator [Streptomyces abyssomicinicus]|uniref:MarR family winged helix-turn-helix transcriptional regulator n=1 Tax=Streptomyces abyssomicinicus TaxID=574929 RepID=UPI001FEB29F9|nr:MarR family winged helix-turn-helix transcriptional regulator [Streptomyces abyssomicinicus]